MHLSLYDLNVIEVVLLLLFLVGYIVKKLNRLMVLTRRTCEVLIHGASRLFPKENNLIVYGGENGMGFRGNTKYLFLEMNKRKDLKCVWIAKSPDVVKEIRDLGYKAYMYKSKRGMWLQLRARLVIHSHAINDDFYKILLGGALSYNTWHGVGLKKVWGANSKTFSYKIMHNKNILHRFFGKFVVRTNQAKKNYVVSTSPKVTSYYPETFLTDEKYILELGQVRNDIFFTETDEDSTIPEWYKHEKIILYMPTHRGKGKLDSNINTIIDFPALNKFCSARGYKFVIKRHMYSSGKVPEGYSNIVDISASDYEPQFLLKYADILVTDYSSAYTDYLLLDRPVIFYCYDLEAYLKKSNEMYHDYYEVTPGPRAETFNEFLEAIGTSIDRPEKFSDDRDRVLNVFYSKENQGKVLDKQVQYIYTNLLML